MQARLASAIAIQRRAILEVDATIVGARDTGTPDAPLTDLFNMRRTSDEYHRTNWSKRHVVIDLHCHFLPGVDDGARTLEESMALVRLARASGITGAVMTPHIYPGVFDNSDETLIPAFAQLKAAIAASDIDFSISLGAEIRLHPDSIMDLIDRKLPLIGHLGDHDLALIEFPDGNIPRGALQACEMLLGKGIRPLLAHPERNKDVMRDPLRIKPFVDAGCLLQVTAASIIGQFGEPALAAAHQLLAMGLVGVVATDSHNLVHRPPRLAEARDALRQLYGQGVAYRLTEEAPASIALR